MVSVLYDNGCEQIIINKEAICEEFFDLSTRLAGEILPSLLSSY